MTYSPVAKEYIEKIWINRIRILKSIYYPNSNPSIKEIITRYEKNRYYNSSIDTLSSQKNPVNKNESN